MLWSLGLEHVSISYFVIVISDFSFGEGFFATRRNELPFIRMRFLK